MKNKSQTILKISLLFIINMIVLNILANLGFYIVMSKKSYLFPPLFSTVVLLFITKAIKK
nr:hypothetical protein [Granulicatella sp. zg-ZJ]